MNYNYKELEEIVEKVINNFILGKITYIELFNILNIDINEIMKNMFEDYIKQNNFKCLLIDMLNNAKKNNFKYQIEILIYIILCYKLYNDRSCLGVFYDLLFNEWHNKNSNVELKNLNSYHLSQLENWNLEIKNVEKILVKSGNIYLDILNELIISKWHTQHIEIVFKLVELKSPLSVEYLYLAINIKLEYLEDTEQDNRFKELCIYGLGVIGNNYALNKLKMLLEDDNEIVLENSIFYILVIAEEKHLNLELNMALSLIKNKKIFDKEDTDIDGYILNRLLISNWHNKHKEIVVLLSKYNCISSINYLFKAINLYLEDTIFCIKCMKVITHIALSWDLKNEKCFKEDLNDVENGFKNLLKVDNKVISKNAIKQLLIIFK